MNTVLMCWEAGMGGEGGRTYYIEFHPNNGKIHITTFL